MRSTDSKTTLLNVLSLTIPLIIFSLCSCSDMLSKNKGNNYDLFPHFNISNSCFSPVVKTFNAGSLIIPMDITYQDAGMFTAYGLIYQLLDSNISVYWSIKRGKSIGDSDFTASSEDYDTGIPIANYGYRGGPFIINSTDASRAIPIIDDWQTTHNMTIHRTTATIEAPVAKRIRSKPIIAVFADGNETIAFRYLNAVGIPDSTGQAWPTVLDLTRQYPGYPDVLDPNELAGTSYTNHKDGALFTSGGIPNYTYILIMHWVLWNNLDPNAALYDEVVSEMRQFLAYSTHLIACCQAITAIENSANGKFLTSNGLAMGTVPADVSYLQPDIAEVQIDGSFDTIGGSVPSFSLAAGSSYYTNTITLMTEAGTPAGINDVWITGYIDNTYSMNYGDTICPDRTGKVCYLGGHSYKSVVPISSNPDSQGTRLILNALFDL